jgi:hypothetical protein
MPSSEKEDRVERWIRVLGGFLILAYLIYRHFEIGEIHLAWFLVPGFLIINDRDRSVVWDIITAIMKARK